jgi:hypothetical protein
MKRAYFPLPFLGLIVVLLIAKLPLPKELSAAILIYVLYLGPYVFVSYYDRYAAPVFAIKALIVCYAVDSIRVLAFQRKLKRLAEST